MLTPLISSEEPPVETITYILKNIKKILVHYKFLTDSYVLDFFTCSHWNKLPPAWRLFFSNVTSKDLHMLLNFSAGSSHHVVPLEIICLRNLINYLSIPRDYVNNSKTNTYTLGKPDQSKKIEKLFWKHIKRKKQHEIRSFAHVIFETASATKCPYIVDVGSGLGHLDRLLAFGYGFRVCGIECNEKLTTQARCLDGLFTKRVKTYDQHFLQTNQPPIHINCSISPSTSVAEFLQVVKEAFAEDVPFGIVGLHPCGDLAPTLLRLYRKCAKIKFINVVGCCYMKLTTESDSASNSSYGYPLSRFALENQFHLSYNAREVACHALESYVARLKSNECWRLRIHCYRAVLEYLIAREYPEYHHSALANVKYQPEMTFSEYCGKALKCLRIKLSEESVNSEAVNVFLSEWRAVLAFYSIRLLFAPLIESTILLDRYLYLYENTDGNCSLVTAFDPLVSPRNHILMGRKGERSIETAQ
ncbi:hypothetical protein Trydic_g12661 [Trypoxylus dichotomus]